MASVSDYSSNYLAEINKRRATNPNDPLIKELEAARDQKILGDVDLYAQYGGTLSTPLDATNPNNYTPGSGIGAQGSIEAQNIISQSPGWKGAYLDGYSSVEEMQNDTGTTATDPYAKMMAQYQAEQQRLADARRQSRISGLGKAKDSALSGLDSEKASIDPYYYDKRNEAAGQSDVGAMNFAQFMAGRGIKGSAGAMPEMYRNAGLQNQVGKLDKQQASEHSDIERRKSGINSAYESDVAGANADIDAQTMQNYITQMQTVQAQRIADQSAQGLTSTGQQTLAGRTAQNSELERQAALLAAQNYDNIQAKIDELSATNPNDPLIPYLYSARRQKIQGQAEQQAAAMASASEAEQQAYENAFKLFESVGRITSPEQAQILGLPQNATAADIDIARMNAQTSRINATKPSGSTGSTTTKPALSANSYDDYIKTNIDLTNSAAVESYLTQLLNSGVDESIVNALAAKYGV